MYCLYCALVQTLAGSLSFFIAKQQTCRQYFQDDLQYGGAQYIATGRGFAIKTSSFLKRGCGKIMIRLYTKSMS